MGHNPINPSIDCTKQIVFIPNEVKSAFLHGELDEEVYVEQTHGYIKRDEEHKVLRLKNALYTLKQTPQTWYSRIESYFLEEEFEKCPSEHKLFIKFKDGKKLIVSTYVDDLLFTWNDTTICGQFIGQ